MLRRFLLSCICIAACTATLPAAGAPPPPTAHMIFLSDIHFNPFADRAIVDRLAASPVGRWRSIFTAANMQRFSGYGSDTDFPLLESALDAMKTEVAQPDEIVITGDFLAHGFRKQFDAVLPRRSDAQYDEFVDKTIAFLALEFEAAFPRSRILPTIGNNDGYCGDYQSTPGSPFLAHMAQAWASSVGGTRNGAFVTQFSKAGYYEMSLPSEHLVAIVLNDIYWSPKYQNACGDAKSDPGGDELAWLTSQLKAIPSGSQAWVIGHIPPGVDVYSTVHAAVPGTVTMFLADRFNDGLVGLLQDPNSFVSLALAGHTHMNDFRIVASPTSVFAVPLEIVPSISPIFANNPSFVVVNVSGTPARIADEAVVTLEGLAALTKAVHGEPHWHVEYRFDRAYGASGVDAANLERLHSTMLTDEPVRDRFDRFYDGGSGRAPITGATWHAYWCGQVAMTAVAYAACDMPQIQTNALPPQPSPPPAPATPPTPAPTPSPLPR
ncbi:MAG: metallophosphoesterase [Vulcanimicrobiaceae bacterium]